MQHGAEVGAEVERILPNRGEVEVELVAALLAVVRVRQGDGGEPFARARPGGDVADKRAARPVLSSLLQSAAGGQRWHRAHHDVAHLRRIRAGDEAAKDRLGALSTVERRRWVEDHRAAKVGLGGQLVRVDHLVGDERVPVLEPRSGLGSVHAVNQALARRRELHAQELGELEHLGEQRRRQLVVDEPRVEDLAILRAEERHEPRVIWHARAGARERAQSLQSKPRTPCTSPQGDQLHRLLLQDLSKGKQWCEERMGENGREFNMGIRAGDTAAPTVAVAAAAAAVKLSAAPAAN